MQSFLLWGSLLTLLTVWFHVSNILLQDTESLDIILKLSLIGLSLADKSDKLSLAWEVGERKRDQLKNTENAI